MHSPLWWLAPPPFPRKRGHYKAPLCCELLMKGLLFRALFCPLNRGKSDAARIGGGERSEPVSRMFFMPYDKESQSRNADFISIAYGNPPPSTPQALPPPERSEHNLPPIGGHNLRPEGLSTFPFTTLLHNPWRSRAAANHQYTIPLFPHAEPFENLVNQFVIHRFSRDFTHAVPGFHQVHGNAVGRHAVFE